MWGQVCTCDGDMYNVCTCDGGMTYNACACTCDGDMYNVSTCTCDWGMYKYMYM